MTGCKLFFWRILLCISLPMAIVVAFTETLCREITNLFTQARLAVADEIACVRRYWSGDPS